MNHSILLENQKKRLELPIGRLVCFAMFVLWQMGFVYYLGPALNIDGRTPLPISMDNITTLIAAGYVLSILWMIFLPTLVIWAERALTIAALLSVLGLFLPLPEESLRLLIYIQAFCCCFMIGFETFVIVNYFSEQTAIKHMTAAYGVAVLLISAVQNDFVPITFPQFRQVTVAALVLLSVFFFGIPTGREACPRYVKKGDGIVAPKKLLTGTFVLVFIASLMGVSGPAISGEVRHGVFLTYLVDALAGLLVYYLYRAKNIHPLRSGSIYLGLGCVGFLLMFVATYVPGLAYVACGLIGFGMVSCQMLPLYNMVLMKSYPSRYLSPITIGLALVAVLVQSSLVELFRSAPTMLYLAYAVIMVILVLLYLQMEPYLMNTLHRKVVDPRESEETGKTERAGSPLEVPRIFAEGADMETSAVGNVGESGLEILSRREMEVAELIGCGYSNGDIAKMLFISEHTVKDHTKNIYRKVGIHSRFELAALVNKWKTTQNK